MAQKQKNIKNKPAAAKIPVKNILKQKEQKQKIIEKKIEESKKLQTKSIPAFLIFILVLIVIQNIVFPIYGLLFGQTTDFIIFNLIISGSIALILHLLILILSILAVYAIIKRPCCGKEICYSFAIILLALSIINLIGVLTDKDGMANYAKGQLIKYYSEKGQDENIAQIQQATNDQMVMGIIIGYIISTIIYALILIGFIKHDKYFD